jgi:hypothetical protein
MSGKVEEIYDTRNPPQAVCTVLGALDELEIFV